MLDALLRVSNSQALDTTGAVSEDKIDLGDVTPRRQIGTGEPMGFMVCVEVAADFTTGNETYEFQAVADEDAALGSPTVLASITRTAAQLAAGTKHWVPLPPGTPAERYIGLNYALGGTTPLITVSAFLCSQSQFDNWYPYRKGYAS